MIPLIRPVASCPDARDPQKATNAVSNKEKINLLLSRFKKASLR
jgi:hypothetical protein